MSGNESIFSSSSSDGSVNEINLSSSDGTDSDSYGESSDVASSEKSKESGNSYDELNNNMEKEYENGDKRRKENKMSEAEKTCVCLSDDAINNLINKCECTRARMTETCRNGFKCSDFMTQQFGLLRTRNIIKQFRL